MPKLPRERGEDKWAMGADENNHVVVLTPEQYAKRLADRNADEAIEENAVRKRK